VNEKVWLVSFPRSGNTWMRFLLANLLYPDEDVNYISIDRFIPDIHQRENWSGVENPLIIKSHNIWRGEYSDSKIVYMYRDPRDVALSYYYFSQGSWSMGFKGTFDEYLKKRFILEGQYGRWNDHVNFWFGMVNKFALLYVKYEDLWWYPYGEMKKIIDFLSIKIEHIADIQIAINKSDFDELEKIRARDGVHLKKKGLQGRPGGWRENLTREQHDLIWEEFGETMEKLGYKK